MTAIYTGTHDPGYLFGAAWLAAGLVLCVVGCVLAERRANRKSRGNR